MTFYPDKPNKHSRLGRIIQLTGWKPKTFYWQYKTVCDYKDRGEGVNRYCTDIRKSTVDKAFAEVFGRSSFLDPNGIGKAVIKSEANFAKDGRIVELPYKLKKGEVCQRLINTFDGEMYVERRALIIEGKCVGFIYKRKPNRFDSRGSTMRYEHRPHEGWSKINAFCLKIGMDYGEIDILSDGSPYLIDANKTPGGASKVETLGEDFINAHRPLFL